MRRIFSFILISMFASQGLIYANNIEYGSYYNCPSMIDYLPTSVNDFCKEWETFKSTGFIPKGTTCQAYYQEMYGDANREFRSGKCSKCGRSFVKTQYEGVTCTMDYVTTPTPRVVGQSCSDNNGNFSTNPKDSKSIKCLNILYNTLKSKYPNIKNGNGGIEVF